MATQKSKEDVNKMPEHPRQCGECYTCCTHLGIEALKKWPGQNCKHLSGAQGPQKRCSIYPNRPSACSKYKCAWIEGLGDDSLRPDRSGLLITAYYPQFENSGLTSITIIITDETKAGTLTQGPLNSVLEQLIQIGAEDIRIVNRKTQSVIHILDGLIRMGKLHKSATYEELIFETYDPPVGNYKTFDNEAEAKEYLQSERSGTP